MVMNLEENVSEACRFEGYLSKQERSYLERKNLVDDEGSLNLDDLLPRDPFGMEFNICLPNDPFSMEPNISLPKDPFGMDFRLEATVAAINGLIEDFGLKTCGFEDDKASESDDGDGEYVAEFNFILAAIDDDERSPMLNGCSPVDVDEEPCNGHDAVSSEKDNYTLFGCEKYQADNVMTGSNPEEEEPVRYTGLDYALCHLGVRDLLRVESVCKSLRNTVRDGLSLWNTIDIPYPWCNVITDDDLVRLTDRARGGLNSLSLVQCLNITSSGLRRVLDSNPELTRLSLVGCTKITGEQVLEHVKAFNSVARPGIKRLRVGLISGVSEEALKEYKGLLGVDERRKLKPRFYRYGELHVSLEDERGIDVEMCPRCWEAKEVYDCPSESCTSKGGCRGCVGCIPRCICCGCCLENRAYQENFVLDLLCLECLAEFLNQPGQLYIITRAEE